MHDPKLSALVAMADICFQIAHACINRCDGQTRKKCEREVDRKHCDAKGIYLTNKIVKHDNVPEWLRGQIRMVTFDLLASAARVQVSALSSILREFVSGFRRWVRLFWLFLLLFLRSSYVHLVPRVF